MAKLGDHREIVLDGGERNAARDVVGAPEHDYRGRLQADHVGLHATQHLSADLAADAAIQEIAIGEIFVKVPDVGDGVAQEHDAGLAGHGRADAGVLVGIAREIVAVRIAELAVFLVDQRAEVSIQARFDVAQLVELLLGFFGKREWLGHGVGERDEGAQVRKESVVGVGVGGIGAHVVGILARPFDQRCPGIRKIG